MCTLLAMPDALDIKADSHSCWPASTSLRWMRVKFLTLTAPPPSLRNGQSIHFTGKLLVEFTRTLPMRISLANFSWNEPPGSHMLGKGAQDVQFHQGFSDSLRFNAPWRASWHRTYHTLPHPNTPSIHPPTRTSLLPALRWVYPAAPLSDIEAASVGGAPRGHARSRQKCSTTAESMIQPRSVAAPR